MPPLLGPLTVEAFSAAVQGFVVLAVVAFVVVVLAVGLSQLVRS